MNPAPVVAARNTNIAVEGEKSMTDQELQKEIRDVGEGIENLSMPDQSLSKEETKRKNVLLLKKDILEKIMDARENNEKDKELQNAMLYGLLTSWGEKHPYLMALVQSNLRWSSF